MLGCEACSTGKVEVPGDVAERNHKEQLICVELECLLSQQHKFSFKLVSLVPTLSGEC